ncbi:MAG: response regulator transcription factor [Ignavibacteriaceae bacterium]|jgi:DNA-binding response OmpR family regulator|nr:response regulator transcription factor [Ignavibacteriaceae bacterium]
MKILIIEDEPQVVEFLVKGLTEKGYETIVAYDGQMGERLVLKGEFDFIILDVILPFINGHELCKRIRERGLQVPILMLTALGTTDDKVSGFDAGADDYLVKPFEFAELLSRIKALTKRTSGMIYTSKVIKMADLTLDLNKKAATRGDKSIDLTGKEFELLEFLMKNAGRVLSRVEIAEKVWDITFETGTNVVDVYISILRKKIDRDFDEKLIHTKVGLGYYIDKS